MKQNTIQRRQFLQAAATGSACWLGWPLGASAATNKTSPCKIDEPFHGAVLNHRHGKQTDNGLQIAVRGTAPADSRVTVNNQPTKRDGEKFVAQVVLQEPETDLTAVAQTSNGRHEDRVRVVWDRKSFPRYRVAIDDNGYFLRDIAEKQYGSLFDCFYLKMLRDLHQKYGTKTVLNIFHTTGEFQLPQFPDRYRSEWADNANWLKLAFHAHTEFPNRPYEDAPPETLIADYKRVRDEILRFAGEATYSPTTVVHFGMTRPSAWKPLFDEGVSTLSGYFVRSNNRWDINYRVDDVRSEYLSRHDALKDFDSGVVFSKIDIVINNTPIERIVPKLAPLAKDPNTAEIMDLLTHEQYFWPFYKRYVPDHAQRMDTAVRWCTEQGYKPVFLHEGLLGAS